MLSAMLAHMLLLLFVITAHDIALHNSEELVPGRKGGEGIKRKKWGGRKEVRRMEERRR